jgi:hypothetical protein
MSIFNEKMMNELEKKPTPIEKSIKKIVEDAKCDTQAFVSKDNAKNIIAGEISELADIIDIAYLDNYDSWTKIVWSLKAIDVKNQDIAMQISEKSSKYDVSGFDKVWNSYTTSKNNFGAGTFFHYCKISDFNAYTKIRSKYHDFCEIDGGTDNEIAKTFVKIFGCDFIYCNKVYYFFNGIYWVADHTGHYLRLKIANELSNFYLDEAKRRLKIINETEDETACEILKQKNKKLLELVNKVQNTSVNSNIQKMVSLYNENNDIQWETNPYLFIFKNKVMDLRIGDWCEPSRDDYMCISCGYDYIEPTEKQIATMNENMKKTIFPLKTNANYI